MDFEQPPSPAKNFLGGSGCGCGCLGLLMILIAGVFVGALYLGYLSGDSASTVYVVGGLGGTTGALLLVVGLLMWIMSIVLD